MIIETSEIYIININTKCMSVYKLQSIKNKYELNIKKKK